MPASKSGLLHIEYQTRSDGSLDFLFIWASAIRGYWNLVCELWTRPLWSHVAGIRFGDDYHFSDFTNRLNWVIAHENDYAKLPGRRGLIQVYPPSEAEQSRMNRFKNAVRRDAVPVSAGQRVTA